MLPPKAVPTERVVAEWASSRGQLNPAIVPQLPGNVLTNVDMAGQLQRILETIPDDSKHIHIEDALNEDTAHDAYFHVDRVDGAAATFVRAAYSARLILLREVDEAPTSISAPLIGFVDEGLADLASCLSGSVVGGTPYVNRWDSRGKSPQVMTRWIRGHQIFAALTQGLIFSFQSMGHAIRAGDGENVRKWADLSISLLRGSGAAFVLTGDFSVEEYNSTVRPSMMPPATPFCLSGLMSADHRTLVQTMKDMKPALKSLHQTDKSRHDAIYEQLATVYDRHIHVCERFVGTSPSLLTAGHTEKSGPALIEQFKALRLKPLESAAQTTRLIPQTRGGSPASCPFPRNPGSSTES
jgi:hypothetical protein